MMLILLYNDPVAIPLLNFPQLAKIIIKDNFVLIFKPELYLFILLDQINSITEFFEL